MKIRENHTIGSPPLKRKRSSSSYGNHHTKDPNKLAAALLLLSKGGGSCKRRAVRKSTDRPSLETLTSLCTTSSAAHCKQEPGSCDTAMPDADLHQNTTFSHGMLERESPTTLRTHSPVPEKQYEIDDGVESTHAQPAVVIGSIESISNVSPPPTDPIPVDNIAVDNIRVDSQSPLLKPNGESFDTKLRFGQDDDHQGATMILAGSTHLNSNILPPAHSAFSSEVQHLSNGHQMHKFSAQNIGSPTIVNFFSTANHSDNGTNHSAVLPSAFVSSASAADAFYPVRSYNRTVVTLNSEMDRRSTDSRASAPTPSSNSSDVTMNISSPPHSSGDGTFPPPSTTSTENSNDGNTSPSRIVVGRITRSDVAVKNINNNNGTDQSSTILVEDGKEQQQQHTRTLHSSPSSVKHENVAEQPQLGGRDDDVRAQPQPQPQTAGPIFVNQHFTSCNFVLKAESSPCKKCGEIFKNATELHTHMFLEHTDLSGDRSDRGTTQKEPSIRHHTHHDASHHRSASDMAACKMCNKAFISKDLLRRHVKTNHQRDQPFRCQLCGKRFSRKGNLQRHVNSLHTQERQYQCRKCGKLFNDPSNCVKHRKNQHKDDGSASDDEDMRPHLVNKANKLFVGNKSFAPQQQ